MTVHVRLDEGQASDAPRSPLCSAAVTASPILMLGQQLIRSKGRTLPARLASGRGSPLVRRDLEVPPDHCPACQTRLTSIMSSAGSGGRPGRADRRQG